MTLRQSTPPLPPLPRSFFAPNAAHVAPRLLGHFLLRRSPAGWSGGRIVEVEAYLENDPASHAFRGETPRNRSMFGPPGHAYVYFIYGNHFCVNVVCQARGVGEAILLRALEVDWGEAEIAARRAGRKRSEWTSGPGRLCTSLGIDRTFDGMDLCATESSLILAENPDLATAKKELGPIVTTTRIGLSQAADRRLRFYLEGSPFVSRRERRSLT